MAGRLDGKVALVTGASSGIGEATAVALAGEGAAVAIAARRSDRLEVLRRKLDEQGASVLVLELDVNDEQACRCAVQVTVDEFGGLDILVNNAGVMLLGAIEGADTTDWTRMIQTNVLGLMFMTHAALPHLLERSGQLVQVSSTAGRVAAKGAGVYNASKFAVNAFSESLRQEVTQRGVRVTLVEPGVVATELRDHITDPRAKESITARAADMRQLQADDIAACAIMQRFGRPGTPTDQAWIESLFGHVKGDWPQLEKIRDPGELERELDRARAEYNSVRLHAGIGYVTPDDEHHGRGDALRQARRDGLAAARQTRIAHRRTIKERS